MSKRSNLRSSSLTAAARLMLERLTPCDQAIVLLLAEAIHAKAHPPIANTTLLTAAQRRAHQRFCNAYGLEGGTR